MNAGESPEQAHGDDASAAWLSRFGEHLRHARQVAGLSQAGLADASGLHRTFVNEVENGKRNVSLLTLRRLAEALGQPPRSLIPPED
jgi:transcriptional regulator with XRE-family HTH domain